MIKIYFNGLVQELASTEILDIIGEAKLNEIRERDPHPLFKAFVLGHEGESSGKLVGMGNVIKRWVKGAIQMLHDKLNIGTPAFFGHAETNDESGRVRVGELVGKIIKTIKEKLHVIGIFHIDKKHQDKTLDIASIEADADFILDHGSMKADAVKINDISGVALANSTFSKPGFPGATLQAQIQELADGIGGDMPKDEIIKAIKQEGFIPSELFAKDDLIGDPEVVNHIRDRNKNEYQARKRNQDEFTGIENDYKKKLTAAETERDVEKKKNLKRDAVTLLETKMVNGRNLDDKKKQFIKSKFDKDFIIADIAKWELEVDPFIDKMLIEFDETAKLLGIEVKPNKDEGDKTAGIKASNKPISSEGKDLTDPANNDFIPQ